MQNRILSMVAFTALSSSAYGLVNIEVGAGSSSQTFKNSVTQKDETVKSSDLDLALGYHLRGLPLTLGLLVTQKNYNTSDLANEIYGAGAKSFYEDPAKFSSPADLTSASIKGSWKGLMYGPEVVVSAWFFFVDPYIRAAYQVGTLKSTVDYASTGDSMGAPVAYDFSVKNDLKATAIRAAIGLKFSLGPVHIFGEYGIENLNTKSTSEDIAMTQTYNGTTQSSTQTQKISDTLKGKGKEISGGIGLRL